MYRRLFCALLGALFLFFFQTNASAAETELIRLHVMADGDDAQSQFVKLRVRDACLAVAQEKLSACETADEAYLVLDESLEDFTDAALETAAEYGFEGEIAVETGTFAFPDRLYGEVLVPAGDYRALRVTLGSGEGHNWWCVLYPSLCVLDEEAYIRSDGEISFYSSIGNALGDIFGG